MEYLKQLQWRYATKRMNGQKIPAESLEKILEAIRLAPTSLGLQPFRVIVVENRDTLEKLKPAANGQAQITESSQVLVFAGYTELPDSFVDAYMDNISKTRGVTAESLAGFRKAIISTIKSKDQTGLHAWVSKQAYIALGFGLVAASLESVDATPMEGFNPEKVDQVLQLKEKNLTSVCLLTLGYRDENNDPLSKQAKVRRPKEDFFLKL